MAYIGVVWVSSIRGKASIVRYGSRAPTQHVGGVLWRGWKSPRGGLSKSLSSFALALAAAVEAGPASPGILDSDCCEAEKECKDQLWEHAKQGALCTVFAPRVTIPLPPSATPLMASTGWCCIPSEVPASQLGVFLDPA